MIVAAALCPDAPVLVPRLASGAAAELDEVRTACASAISAALTGADEVVVIGGDPGGRRYGADAGGSFREFGVEVRAGPAGAPTVLPAALAVGGWLLDAYAADLPRSYAGVAPSAPTDECGALGADLAAGDRRTALLVLGSGSARRTDASPGRFDPRAEPLDDVVERALGTGDTAALLAVDAGLAADLMVSGRAPWQVLAAAVGASADVGATTLDARAPYGVRYVVAAWRVS